jgi:UDP-galactopyranose mutase
MIDSINNCDIVIVGAGLFGSVIAEQASRDGLKVVVLESRDHIGGNCYTEDDEQTGINIHKYGPHIFHTSNERVWKYIN